MVQSSLSSRRIALEVELLQLIDIGAHAASGVRMDRTNQREGCGEGRSYGKW
jgi:hypothetical protein